MAGLIGRWTKHTLRIQSLARSLVLTSDTDRARSMALARLQPMSAPTRAGRGAFIWIYPSDWVGSACLWFAFEESPHRLRTIHLLPASVISAPSSSGASSSLAGSRSDSAYRYAMPFLTFAAGSTCPPGIWHMPAFPVSFQRRGRPHRHARQSPPHARRRSGSHSLEAWVQRRTKAVKTLFRCLLSRPDARGSLKPRLTCDVANKKVCDRHPGIMISIICT